jgi:hypothetical protein
MPHSFEKPVPFTFCITTLSTSHVFSKCATCYVHLILHLMTQMIFGKEFGTHYIDSVSE